MYRIFTCLCTLTASTMLVFATQPAAPSNTGTGAWNQAAREESSSNPNGMQSPRARLSNEVSLLLYDTSQARAAAKSNELQQATQDVKRALQADSQIASQRANHKLVPLYSELDEYSVIGPIAASRSADNNSTNQNGAAQTNNQTANQNRPEALAVRQVTGQYTAAELDPALARTHLQAAQQALANGNVQVANEALKGVEDSVILVSVGSDLPLVRARDNLVLARMDARHGQYQKAHLDLQAACRALTAYANSGGAFSGQAQTLRSQIQNYNRNIQNDHAQAAGNIESWWNQTAGWMTPAQSNGAGS